MGFSKAVLEKAKEFWDRGRAYMLPDGSELLDPRPMELPVGFQRPESIQEIIRRLVTDPAMRAELSGNDMETFDEADDFDTGDDLPVQSPYEEQFDPMGIVAREQEVRAGQVKPRSIDEINAAAKVLADCKGFLEDAKAAKSAAKAVKSDAKAVVE